MSHKQDTSIKKPSLPPLYELFLYPSHAVADAHLKGLCTMIQQDRGLCVPSEALDLINEVQKDCPLVEYKLYTILCWIMAEPQVQKYFTARIPLQKWNEWYHTTLAYFDTLLVGVQPNGEKYAPGTDLQSARASVFIRHVATALMEL